MTDLLVKPDDTGEIPRPVGETTERLHPMIATGPFPTIRRSDATGEQPVYRPSGFAYLDTEVSRATVVIELIEGLVERPDRVPLPDPLPPPPPPKPANVWQAEPEPAYVGKHRRPSRWDWLTVPLSAAVQIIRAAL